MDKPVAGDGSKSNSAAAAASANRHQTQYKNKGKDADVRNSRPVYTIFVLRKSTISTEFCIINFSSASFANKTVISDPAEIDHSCSRDDLVSDFIFLPAKKHGLPVSQKYPGY